MKPKNIINTVVITLIFCGLWVWLEKLIYGVAESRVVDDIMILLMIPFFYFASDRFESKKVIGQGTIRSNDTLNSVGEFRPFDQNAKASAEDMNKNYWEVNRGRIYAVITCPICKAWFDVPNAPGNIESYTHCPNCTCKLEVRKEDQCLIKRACDPDCTHLVFRKEDYDDDTIGYCHAIEDINGKLIGMIDDIHAGTCECIMKDEEK